MRRIVFVVLIGLLALGGIVGAQEASDTAVLQVTESLPSDGSFDADPDGALVAVFNRPVVPLTAVEALGDLPDPLRIEPTASGTGEWLNSAIYLFRPDPALAGGTTYTVTVDPTLTALDGAAFAVPQSWTFTTTTPEIIEIVPEPSATGVRIERPIQVRFNMPMDRASTEAAFQLAPTGEASGPAIAGTFEWAEDGAGFAFRPAERLALDTVYQVSIGTGATGAGGGAGLQADPWSFVTVPEPGIIRTEPSDGQERADNLYAFTVYFASPMNPDTLEGRVNIDPEPWREPDSYYNDWDNAYTLSFPVEPSTAYTITIEPGTEDIYGNRIEEPLVVRYTTMAFSADISLEAPYGIGFYNAYNDQTRVYLTHRNVSRVDLELYSVRPSDLLPVLVGPNAYDPSSAFRPSGDQLLRQWSIESVAPENARRYELLDLGANTGANIVCPGSPPTRLGVGATARVISDPDPVRARATPGDGEIVTLLYRDYTLSIIGGPACVGDLLWWQVRLREGEEAWVAEGAGDEYFLDAVTPVPQAVEVTSETGALLPGLYYLSLSSPETLSSGRDPLRHFLIVGTANLVMKHSPDQVLIWATDVNSGLPLVDVPINVYGRDYMLLGQGRTDASGLLRIDVPRTNDLYEPRMAVLDDGDHFGIGLAQWSQGIEGWDFALPTAYSVEQFRAYVYTDRPIYRPDQPVYFRGVVRARDDVTYTLAELDEIPVRIYGGDDDALLYEETLPLTPFGTFSGQFDLAADAPLGYYRIEAELPRPDPFRPYYGSEGVVSFQVAQYRAPEFQVEVTPEQTEVVRGDMIRVLVDSRYFFGGVVSNANVEYAVVARPNFFSAPGAAGYSFVDFNDDAGPSERYGGYAGEIASGSGTTDASGQFMIEFTADLQDATQSQAFTIEATVSDESGQAVAGRADVVVHPGLVYVGVKPREYVATAGQETTIDLLTVDWADEQTAGVANQTIEVEVVERRWSSVLEEDEFGRTTWTWEVEDIPITDGRVTTDSEGRASFTFTPPAGGNYKITARTQDERGNTITASSSLYVSSGQYIIWRQQNSNRIDLIADQDSYQVGDTAEILIASPFQGTAEALVTVERGDVLLAERITLDTNSYIYQLPITADYSPNVFVSVLIVKGVDENNPVAAFRMGMVQIGVDTSQRELTLEITPDREQVGPGDEVTYTLRATDFTGSPVQAEIGVGLTDLASLSIADPNTISILEYYFGSQWLGVRTSTALTINTDQLTQTVLDTIKGGGGGFGEGGIFDIRQEFIDTAYWNASLTTNADGEVQFTVTLPDNLTTWRLDARALTRGAEGDLLVGQETFDLISTKPLLVRPITPRFFVAGDTAVVAAIVNNNTDAPIEAEVTLEIGSQAQATTDSPLTQIVTIPALGRQRVEWALAIERSEGLALTFFARGGEYTDASVPPLAQGADNLLPVYTYSAPETTAVGGALQPGEQVTEVVRVPPELNADAAELTVQVQPSLAASALSGLEALELSPRPSAEEVVSTFLPNLMINRALQAAGIDERTLQDELSSQIARALQYLYSAQKTDGGWGWYVRDRSDVTVTAYALIGLAEAQVQGFRIDGTIVTNAQRFLRASFIVPGLDVPRSMMNRQALVLYALARSGSPDAGRAATLFDSRDQLSLYAQALLAQTLAISDPNDPRIPTLLDNLARSAILSANGVHWEEAQQDRFNWNTDTRTTAIVLDAFAQLRPQSELIPGIVRWLNAVRRVDGWETRQETAWSLMALGSAATALGEDFTSATDVCVRFGRTALLGCTPPLTLSGIQTAVGQSSVSLTEATPLDIAAEGARLYYTAQLTSYLPVPTVEPINRGIVIERRYTMGEGDDLQTIEAACVGDTVTVRLTIIAPNALNYVIVEDPIPAGTDAVNPDLAISEQIGTQPELSREDPLSQGWGWWWFSNIEFRDDRVVLSASYLPAGTYEFVYSIRAGLPGVYNVIPATAREAYFPEVFGRSAGLSFGIGPEGGDNCPAG